MRGTARATRVVIFVAVLAGLGGAALERGGAEPPTGAGRGNAKAGERLFATLPCVSCHDITRPWPGGDICPNLGNIATEAARIVRSRQYHGKARKAADYIRESIVDPDAYIVPGEKFRAADGHSLMPRDFGQTLTAAQIDDLVAFLLTRR
jgi:nitric oxide reductase subunit C